MSGVGPLEILIVVAIAALIFGAPVVTFLLGYGLGRRKADAAEPPERMSAADAGQGDQQDD